MRLALAIAWLALAQAASATQPCGADAVYLVRHAEKAADGSDDPPLSEAGQRSAQALADWFEGKALDAVYATHLRRTQQTALPLATQRDLDLRVLAAGDTARLVKRLRRKHCGESVLVVGHSNTVPQVAMALWGAEFTIPEQAYGVIYRITPDGAVSQTRWLAPGE